MFGAGLGAVLDPEVVDGESELDAVVCVLEQAGDTWILSVAVLGEVAHEMVLRNAASRGGLSAPKKPMPPATERARERERYDAPE